MSAHRESFPDQTAVHPPQDRANSPACLLVVDDDPDIRQLTAEALSSVGHQVDTAEDGAAGWAALQTNSYDLLITDHNMPKVSGVELLKKLRAAHMALPAILISGALPTEELNRHPRLQIEATLLKPYTVEKLLGTVAEVLRATNEPDRSTAGVQSQPPADGWQLL
jgi:two-component system, OmpR family, response regulator